MAASFNMNGIKGPPWPPHVARQFEEAANAHWTEVYAQRRTEAEQTPASLIGEPYLGRSASNGPIRLDLTETDMDDWRDAVVHGTGPLGAYAPDPDAAPVAALPADAPSPIVWHRPPDRIVQGVRLVLIAAAVVFAFALLGDWMSA